MKDLLRAGVVGVGHFGRHHARVYSELDGVELVGVVDVDRERARTVARELGTVAFDHLSELLDRVDAVSVAVPTHDHKSVSAQALEHGVSVLVEKPMAATLEEAVELRETAERSGATLQVGHIMRFNPVVAVVHEMHIEPKFLETQRLSPFSFRSLDVGVVLDMMIHDIDLVLQLTSGLVERVDAVGCAIVGDVEDMCNARIAFDDGAVANLTASRTSLKTLRRARIFSTGSYISMDFVANTGLIIQRSEKWSTDTVDMEKLRELPVDQLKQVMTDGLFTVKEMKLDETEPLRAELASFVDSVMNEHEPLVGADDGIRCIETAEKILAAVRAHHGYR